MAINANILRRPAERGLFTAAAIIFPLLVLIGFSRSYYFRSFFEQAAPPPANWLVQTHGAVMTLWVVFFTIQIALVRVKNIKLHISLGMLGIALGIVVFIVGVATAYDTHIIRGVAPGGGHPYSFFVFPLGDMLLFAILFAGAIYYRRRPAEHKSLMLLIAINFMSAPLGRIQILPEDLMILWAFGLPDLCAIGYLAWLTVRHRRLNKILATGVLLLIISQPLRILLSLSETWIQVVGWLVPKN